MVNFNLQGLSDPNSLPATTQPAQPVKDEFAMPSLSDTLKPHELELINQTFPEGSTPGAKSELESLVSGAKATGTTPQGVFAEREAQKASDNAMSVATEATPDTMLADQVSKFSGNLDMLKELHPDAGNLTIDQMRAVIGQSASIPQYQYKPPTLAENLAAGLAMMLAPNSNPLGHITASHTRESQDQYARDVQQYQMEQGAKQQQFQNLHNIASLQLQQMQTEATKLYQQGQLTERQHVEAQTALQNVSLAISRQGATEDSIRSAMNAANESAARTGIRAPFSDVKGAAHEAYKQAQEDRLQRASSAWDTTYQHHVNTWGEVTPDQQKQLEEQRMAIAARYFTPDMSDAEKQAILSQFTEPTTGESWKAKYQKSRLEDYKQQLGISQQKADQSGDKIAAELAKWDAEIALQQRHAVVAERNSDTQSGHLAIAQWMAANKNRDAAADKLITDLDAKRAEEEGKRGAAATSAQKHAIDETIAGINAKQKFLKGVQLFKHAGATIETPFGTIPNPYYKAGANATFDPSKQAVGLSGSSFGGTLPPGVRVVPHQK